MSGSPTQISVISIIFSNSKTELQPVNTGSLNDSNSSLCRVSLLSSTCISITQWQVEVRWLSSNAHMEVILKQKTLLGLVYMPSSRQENAGKSFAQNLWAGHRGITIDKYGNMYYQWFSTRGHACRHSLGFILLPFVVFLCLWIWVLPIFKLSSKRVKWPSDFASL